MTLSETKRAGWRPSATGLAVGALSGLLARDLDLRSLLSYWHDVHVMLTAIAVAGALLWRTRLRLVFVTAAVALAVVWLAVAFTPLTTHLASGLVRRDPPRPADAIFVLASRIQADGELTNVALGRLARGLELLAQRQAPRLILSEMHAPSRTYAEPASQLIRSFHIEGELLTVGPVHNTHDEAREVARLCREHGWRTLLLVTSPTHSRRAAATFERQGLTVISVPAVETRFDLETLNMPADRLGAFSTTMHERLGLWVYKRRGWL
jgi:uncharacterized SAM-binding protein YcdF (DUF218 family)